MATEKYASFGLSLGLTGLNILASGTSALVLAVGMVAVGLTGIGFFWWNKAEENKVQEIKMQERQSSGYLRHCMAEENKVQEIKMQERQSSGYLRHVLVTTGIVTFLFIFFYCFTSLLTGDKNGLMSSYRN